MKSLALIFVHDSHRFTFTEPVCIDHFLAEIRRLASFPNDKTESFSDRVQSSDLRHVTHIRLDRTRSFQLEARP
jgi:hypothetical protein